MGRYPDGEMLGAVRESFGTTRERARRIIAASPNATSWNLADSGPLWFGSLELARNWAARSSRTGALGAGARRREVLIPLLQIDLLPTGVVLVTRQAGGQPGPFTAAGQAKVSSWEQQPNGPPGQGR